MATVLTEREGVVLTVTLNRPEKLNAFTEEMHADLRTALDEVASDRSVRAVILTGAGRAFSAGQDLSDRVMGKGDAPPDLGDTLERLYNPLIARLADLPVPTVAAINGAAAGASMNIALACDILIAGRSAKFLQPFANLGLVPDAGGTFMLPRAIGTPRARAMMMLAEAVDAETAERWGLVWRMVEDEALIGEAQRAAARLASLPNEGLLAIRRTLAAGASATLGEQLTTERDAQRLAGRHPDYAEGVAAFMEKRRPQFAERS